MSSQNKLKVFKGIVAVLVAPFLAVLLLAFGIVAFISTVMVYVAWIFGLNIEEYETNY